MSKELDEALAAMVAEVGQEAVDRFRSTKMPAERVDRLFDALVRGSTPPREQAPEAEPDEVEEPEEPEEPEEAEGARREPPAMGSGAEAPEESESSTEVEDVEEIDELEIEVDLDDLEASAAPPASSGEDFDDLDDFVIPDDDLDDEDLIGFSEEDSETTMAVELETKEEARPRHDDKVRSSVKKLFGKK